MESAGKLKGLSSFELSLVAAAAMTVDHIGAVFAVETPLYFPMRAVGRISFVLFAFLISQSVERTSSVKRFCLRLLLFALISEPIFDMAFYGRWFFVRHQNIFFTLMAGVLCCSAMKKGKVAASAAFAAAAAAAELLRFDYGGMGVVLITAFYLLGKRYAALIAVVFAASSVAGGAAAFELFGIAAAPLMVLYNGDRGGMFAPRFRKWFFYLYYPAHLLIICIWCTV